MGSVSVRTTAVLTMLFCLGGSGCIHIHTDPEGRFKSVEMRVAPYSSTKNDPGAMGEVKQVSSVTAPKAAVPAAASTPAAQAEPAAPTPSFGSRLASFRPSLPKIPGLTKPTVEVAEATAMWQNQIAYLPDPTRNGAPGPGLLGELFLIGTGPKMPFADADGGVTFTIYDESRGAVASKPLGSWTFDKETLKRLVTVDERLGKCYAIFLPWPEYRPTITRVRLTSRYEPEGGHPLFATTWVTFDAGSSSTERVGFPSDPPAPWNASSPAAPGAGTMPSTSMGGYPMPPAAPPPMVPSFPPPIPLSGTRPGAGAMPGAGAGTAPHSTGLPPLTITLPNRP